MVMGFMITIPTTLGDDCPIKDGTSTIDKQGCPDSDNDGWSDEGDKFPFDPNIGQTPRMILILIL